MEVYQKLQLVMSAQEVGFFPLLLVIKDLLKREKMADEEFMLFLNHSIFQFPYYPDEVRGDLFIDFVTHLFIFYY